EAFPESYEVSSTAAMGADDIDRIEELLKSGDLQVSLSRRAKEGKAAALHLSMYAMERVTLADSMPALGNLGLRVVSEVPTDVRPAGTAPLYMDVFEIENAWPDEKDLGPLAILLEQTLRAVFSGAVDDDPLNRLVTEARIGWRAVDVIRAYITYAKQIGTPFSIQFYREVLIRNVGASLALFAIFDARFNPKHSPEAREKQTAASREAFEEKLKEIPDFNDDRVLRTLRNFVDSTLRTNYYRHRANPYFLTLKIDGAQVENLPLPRPAFELLVRGPQMEGMHLRGGRVARGGLRWSDRLEDYRTEILGLMKTQQVKNALIVPVGAKGGFILKTKPLPRDEARKLADARYEILIRGFLDVTDNRVDGKILKPRHVVAYDGDDPYFVVAADKGTAHLSDTANRISEEAGFWLGDAFASGGSHGYDHKKEGITAKGAWTCVRRHFVEMGIDVDKAPIRVLGIGDMSGDVFGNGMLLSRHMKLVAAFNHLHVFLDPDPDPEKSFAERERLFNTPGSTWNNYDRALISEGGGVFPRQAKAIPLPPAVKVMLGVEAGSLGGEELIRTLLRAEFDLLWNGGIGTYIKGADETDLEVGDKANERVRVKAPEVRAKVIGEGGNLGITQRGRIELSLRGVRLNSDAIDNSAGVDLSDHEVNLKIGLQPLVREKRLDFEARNRLLTEIKAEVCEMVTEHNWSQSRLISLDQMRSRRSIEEFIWLIDALESEGKISRAEDCLPSAKALLKRRDNGQTLSRPEISVLLGHAKLDAYEMLLASEFIDSSAFEPMFEAYFPEAVRRLDPVALRAHPLRREITATQLANLIVDWGGTTFMHELVNETGRDPGEIAAAYIMADEVLGAAPLRRDLEATGFDSPVTTRYEAFLLIEDTLIEAVRWVLPTIGAPERWRDIVEEYRTMIAEASPQLQGILSPSRRALSEQRFVQLCEGGLPEALARRVAVFRGQLRWVDIGRIAREAGEPAGWSIAEVGQLYYALGEAAQLDWMLLKMAEAPKPAEWDNIAYGNLRGELIRKQHAIVAGIISGAKPGLNWQSCWLGYRRRNARIFERLARDRAEIETARLSRFTPFSVLGQLVKGLP
ncbi:MAG: NAD-glutamate dehydrogenase, partial [Deltaproteobacteria bacterium]|nr:NAD-glutamate dehydrogenase [Deltaproteobacteria bacterium]